LGGTFLLLWALCLKQEEKMKKPVVFVVLGSVVAALFVLRALSAFAAVPHLINYQGMLTNGSGTPLSGLYDITFKIYDAELAGTQKWTETQSSVSVTNGLFNVILGSSNPLDLDFSQDYWLDITVQGEHMPARLKFTSVGYAYRAEKADTADYARGGGGGAGSPWIFRLTDGNDTTITTGGRWGVARYGNALLGTGDSTHVNLGVACTTGATTWNDKYNTVGGGFGNVAGGYNGRATVGGGYRNAASWECATVAGGGGDTASANYATVGGGSVNRALGHGSTVAGGLSNTASNGRATVGGGWENTASAQDAVVGGGEGNCASGIWSAVGGGLYDTASNYSATVPGGQVNKASGQCSFAAGMYAKAIHDGSFVWADYNTTDFYSQGNNTFNIRATGGVYSTSNSNAYGAQFQNSGDGDGVRAYTNVSKNYQWGAVYAVNYGTSPAIYADAGGDTAAYFNGSVVVTGTVYKSALASIIDHPLDPENKYLCHSGVESPDMMNIYNGNVTLDAGGEAWVELPGWFEALNRDFRYQLTCIGAFAPVYIAQKISSSRFKIAGGQPGTEVSWQVTGIRQDPYAEKHRIRVEEEKLAGERGKYLHPDAYNMPETMGMGNADKESKK
jgi:hypothetical protein